MQLRAASRDAVLLVPGLQIVRALAKKKNAEGMTCGAMSAQLTRQSLLEAPAQNALETRNAEMSCVSGLSAAGSSLGHEFALVIVHCFNTLFS